MYRMELKKWVKLYGLIKRNYASNIRHRIYSWSVDEEKLKVVFNCYVQRNNTRMSGGYSRKYIKNWNLNNVHVQRNSDSDYAGFCGIKTDVHLRRHQNISEHRLQQRYTVLVALTCHFLVRMTSHHIICLR